LGTIETLRNKDMYNIIEGSMKKRLFGMPIVAMVVVVSIFCSCGNKGNAGQDQTTTDSVVVESTGAGNAPIDMKVVEASLHKIFSALITEDGDRYLPEYFTEGFNANYKKACEKAMKEGFESPRIWWQESESDPSQFVINSVTTISDNEVKSNVTLKSEISKCDFEVTVKKENGNWLIDKITQKEEYQQVDEGTEAVISFEDALVVAKDMIIENGSFKGFRSPNKVESIMANYGYKKKKRYYVYRAMDFEPLYHKNCSFKDSSEGDEYSEVPSAGKEGTPSFVGIDNTTVVIAPFTKEALEEYVNQIRKCGASLIEEDKNDGSRQFKLGAYDISVFTNLAWGLKYAIMISKE